MSPKAAEMRGVMKIVDDTTNAVQQISTLFSVKIGLMVFTDSRPLLETFGSTSQVAGKAFRQSVAYLMQCMEKKEIDL